jgi:hypothetical protein
VGEGLFGFDFHSSLSKDEGGSLSVMASPSLEEGRA